MKIANPDPFGRLPNCSLKLLGYFIFSNLWPTTTHF